MTGPDQASVSTLATASRVLYDGLRAQFGHREVPVHVGCLMEFLQTRGFTLVSTAEIERLRAQADDELSPATRAAIDARVEAIARGEL